MSWFKQVGISGMKVFDNATSLSRPFHNICVIVVFSMALSACQPLYSSQGLSANSPGFGALPGSSIAVTPVKTRTGQQVSNHLAFLLQGGQPPIEPKYRVDLSTSTISRNLASSRQSSQSTAGNISVTANYTIVETGDKPQTIASGKRIAQASYDRTAQSFANERAERDAENRAAREVAESLRLAILSDIRKVNNQK